MLMRIPKKITDEFISSIVFKTYNHKFNLYFSNITRYRAILSALPMDKVIAWLDSTPTKHRSRVSELIHPKKKTKSVNGTKGEKKKIR